MKKEILNNGILRGIEILILLYGDKLLSIDLNQDHEVRELSEVEAKNLIRRKDVLLLSFGNYMESTSWMHFASGYQIPLSSKTERDVTAWFYSDPEDRNKGIDSILRLFWIKEQDGTASRILTRQPI